jgi:hypothetical protein
MDKYIVYVVPLAFAYFLYRKGNGKGLPPFYPIGPEKPPLNPYGPIGPAKPPRNPYGPVGPVQPPLQTVGPSLMPISPLSPSFMPLKPLAPSVPGIKPVTPNSCTGLASTSFSTYPDLFNPCPDVKSGWNHEIASQALCSKLAGKGYIPALGGCMMSGQPTTLKFAMYWLRGQ